EGTQIEVMTVMLPKFFGVPQHLVRSGLLKRLKPAEVKLYLGLLHDSERYRNRELIRSDQQLTDLIGVSPRSLRDARIKLQEHGLVQYELPAGRKGRYVICNPETGKPYPGDPRQSVPYLRKGTQASPVPRPDQRGEKAVEQQKMGSASSSLPPDDDD